MKNTQYIIESSKGEITINTTFENAVEAMRDFDKKNNPVFGTRLRDSERNILEWVNFSHDGIEDNGENLD